MPVLWQSPEFRVVQWRAEEKPIAPQRVLVLQQMGTSTITFTTDFGTRDGYAGAVKGVIRSINPAAQVVDITHEIEPFDVLGAAFALGNFYSYFPRGTIHLVVVDPGVGSQRQPLLVKTEDFFFVGPDNGIFTFVYNSEKLLEIIAPSNREYFLAELSSTFHARDMFAPVAAYLSLGVDPKEFGASAKECFKLVIPQPKPIKSGLVGEIIHIDRFGNLVTNIPAELVGRKKISSIMVGKKKIKQVALSYFDIPEGQAGVLVGSSGLLEIAVSQASAQSVLRSKIGTPVRISFR